MIISGIDQVVSKQNIQNPIRRNRPDYIRPFTFANGSELIEFPSSSETGNETVSEDEDFPIPVSMK